MTPNKIYDLRGLGFGRIFEGKDEGVSRGLEVLASLRAKSDV